MSLYQIPNICMAKPVIGNEEIAEVVAVLRSGFLSEGEAVATFEKAFAEYIECRHAVAVNSGTAAIYVALLAHGIGSGDEVITSPFTFIATANAVLLTGARPVFADIEMNTYNIDPDEVKRRITSNTKAIMPVHLYGQLCKMNELMSLAERYGLAMIEDACQAHGAEYLGRKAGSFGTGCFSFYSTKNMSTGEGGMVTTDNDDVAFKLRTIRNHGQTWRYHHEMLGHNYRMTNIAGALGLCQLKKLEQFNKTRIRNAQLLTEGLEHAGVFVLPSVEYGYRHVFHQYTLRMTKFSQITRAEFRRRLQDNGISTEIYYPCPVHMQPIYRELGYDQHLPGAEEAAREVVSLPVHPSVSEQDIHYIIDCIERILG